MTVDVDAFLAAAEPPSFTVGARTYRGRPLSALEHQAFAGRLAQMDRNALSDEESAQLIYEWVDAMFPPPPPQVERRWFGLRRRRLPQVRPVDVFCALPLGAQLELVKDFSRCLAMTPPALGEEQDGGARATRVAHRRTMERMTRTPTPAGGEGPRPLSRSS